MTVAAGAVDKIVEKIGSKSVVWRVQPKTVNAPGYSCRAQDLEVQESHHHSLQGQKEEKSREAVKVPKSGVMTSLKRLSQVQVKPKRTPLQLLDHTGVVFAVNDPKNVKLNDQAQEAPDLIAVQVQGLDQGQDLGEEGEVPVQAVPTNHFRVGRVRTFDARLENIEQ